MRSPEVLDSQRSAAGLTLALLLLGGLLSACVSRPLGSVPVEDRGSATSRPAPSVGVPGQVLGTGEGIKQLPGFENAGKPGYYSVKPGDTLIRIGLETGQTSRDLARWNNLENPNLIEVGQVLRVVPPTNDNPLVVTRPVTSGNVASNTTTNNTTNTTSVAPIRPASAAASPQPVASDDDIAWIWPAQGRLLAGFDEVKNKGYDIDGKAGDPVVASGDGRVVYAGAGLRGYGNLIILKHNNTYLTAYAHNQTLLVKEDQSVKKGQKIAEMGNSDADRVKLHFEIRRQGKPVDPAKYLPAK